ncbi:MAG: hypothetical protein KQ78_01548 [Candidatus Izimaplasma bacterium HR2]|nr:MAG: hypothetical protein KQ78_01548 [Candidatus Izimaplasma bacterium HR2]
MFSNEDLSILWERVKETEPNKFKKFNQNNRNSITLMMFDLWKQEEIDKSDWDGVTYCEEMMEFEGMFGVEEYNQILDYVNSINKIYCVYVWFINTEEGKSPFYVGKGKKHRAQNIKNRSKEFLYIINEFDCDYEIIKEGLSEHQALVTENEFINYFRSKGANLVNKSKSRPSYHIF